MTTSNIKVLATPIIGCNEVVYSAWAPRSELKDPRTLTYSTFGDGCYGKIGSDPDRTTFNHLPVSQERSKAVAYAYSERYDVAYSAIYAAHPELRSVAHTKDLGEIRVIGGGK